MGTLAKRLGQVAAKSLESESSNIIKTIGANKSGLSKALDSTLKTSHDMKVFGLGTAASMSSRARYTRFTSSMFAVYSSMEDHFDRSLSPANRLVWDRYGSSLRRGDALRQDLEEVGGWPASEPSVETALYVDAIREAGLHDDETGGGRLLGHLYCRYFADLFGGQALGGPYRWALSLEANSPRHYDFGAFGAARRESIEKVYVALNEAGELLGDDAVREEVVVEARRAFMHNVAVYKEEGALVTDGAVGIAKMALGFARSRWQQQTSS